MPAWPYFATVQHSDNFQGDSHVDIHCPSVYTRSLRYSNNFKSLYYRNFVYIFYFILFIFRD
jgi:hypothetical protein